MSGHEPPNFQQFMIGPLGHQNRWFLTPGRRLQDSFLAGSYGFATLQSELSVEDLWMFQPERSTSDYLGVRIDGIENGFLKSFSKHPTSKSHQRSTLCVFQCD